ncbi:hypothetical protein [Demequina gelatinilytica]|uniref:hypothetical protein n=1 Tax=Demequina gelatinilytica TaxID=1638980 RepID=UPI000780B599|nr:hypothetical protein [Demequina gelatinilytica]
MTTSADRRLAFFVHFHKAGGTSVVELAHRNGETLYPRHANGNPLDERGKVHRPWDLSAEALHAYVDDLLDSGVTFIATEWAVPALEVLGARPDVQIVTVMREPVARLISNFRYDYANGYTEHTDIIDYVDDHIAPHTSTSYYTKMLLGADWQEDAEPEELLTVAQQRLEQMDVVGVLEQSGWVDEICETLGWEPADVKANPHRQGWSSRLKRAVKSARGGRTDLAMREFRPVPEVSDVQKARLREWCDLDRELYARVVSARVAA